MHTSLDALAAGGRRFDLVVSRAVLEHVRDLRALFAAVSKVVTDDAVLVHKVDLRSHGIEHGHPLDFLRFSERAWRAMSSHIDVPNREDALVEGNLVNEKTQWNKAQSASLPASLFLKEKPAFWGEKPWPGIGADVDRQTMSTLPAQDWHARIKQAGHSVPFAGRTVKELD